MNWIKIIFSGIVAWTVPFVFNTFLFPNLPDSLQFVIYLLTAVIVLIDFSNNIMNGYLRKRNKITVATGLTIGLIWFLIAFMGSAGYYLFIKNQALLDFSIQTGSLFLIYPVLGITVGICEERRGRKR